MNEETLRAMQAASPNVHNGTYTVSHPDHGHYTLRLRTAQRGDLAGRRILELLTGPNNDDDFQAFAFWDDERKVVNVWSKYKHPESRLLNDGYHWQSHGWSKHEKKAAVWCDLVMRLPECSHWRTRGYKIQASTKCVHCNRSLTVPKSIELGVGPSCALKIGVRAS